LTRSVTGLGGPDVSIRDIRCRGGTLATARGAARPPAQLWHREEGLCPGCGLGGRRVCDRAALVSLLLSAERKSTFDNASTTSGLLQWFQLCHRLCSGEHHSTGVFAGERLALARTSLHMSPWDEFLPDHRQCTPPRDGDYQPGESHCAGQSCSLCGVGRSQENGDAGTKQGDFS